MSMFDNPVKVTGEYAFSFTTFIWEHEWDGRDYAYCHEVDEEEGLKAYHCLEHELGVYGKTMKELFQLKWGEHLKDENCGEDVRSFCMDHSIRFEQMTILI